MTWFWAHGEQLFFLFLFPLRGLILERFTSKRTMLYNGHFRHFIFTSTDRLLPIFFKKIETQIDSTQNCKITFIESKVIFDKCKGDINEMQ